MIEFEDIICCLTEYENFEAIPGEVIQFAVRLINTKAKRKITTEN